MSGMLVPALRTAAALAGGAGSALILFDIFRVPYFRTSHALSSFVHRSRRKRRGSGRADLLLENLADWISKKVRINESRRMRLETELTAADLKISPEKHVANCIVKGGLAGIATLPLVLFFPPSLLLTALAAVSVYTAAYDGPSKLNAAHREAVEYELPMFVSRIENMLGRTRDVLAVLTSYRRNAGPDMARELGVTIADMQSGNARAALARFESRVGSTMLSDVTRGLIAVMDGNDPVGYWTNLSSRLADYQRQLLMRKAKEMPSKINRLSFILLLCVMLIYAVVIGGELMRSLGVIFG